MELSEKMMLEESLMKSLISQYDDLQPVLGYRIGNDEETEVPEDNEE